MREHLGGELAELFESRAKLGAVKLRVQDQVTYTVKQSLTAKGVSSLERNFTKLWGARVEFVAVKDL